MSILNVVSLLGGLAMFLYGISLMGDGLNMVAGNKLQMVLYRLTSNPIRGILLGIAVTALIQSSSATSVMAIGFVNSGLMEFVQAVSIILGSIVGTSITGWIVSLSVLGNSGGWMELLSTTFITGVVAVIGICMFKFSKKPLHNKVGTILLGFAVLMYGMNLMSSAFSPLRDSEAFTQLMVKFSNPLLGILVGIVFTAVIQSSAAAVGILQALSMTGALTFAGVYPILLGIAVGGALPVLISALGASLNARRTALVHLIIDVLGAVICGVVFYAINSVVHFSFMSTVMNPVTVAALNTIFRVVVVVILTPAIRLLEKMACFLMKEKGAEEEHADWDILEERFIQHPSLAMEQCRIVIGSMAKVTSDNLDVALGLLRQYTVEGYEQAIEMEMLVDQYEDKLGSYLVKVSTSELTEKQNEDLYQFLHAITDLERISDHARNIAENAKEIYDKDIPLTEEVVREMEVMHSTLQEVVATALKTLLEDDLEAAHMVEPLEELIDNLCDEMKHRQTDRLQKGVYSLQNSFVFNDLIGNYERVSDHCSNIAVALIELEMKAFDTHDYIESLMSRKDEEFERYYQAYKAKYFFA